MGKEPVLDSLYVHERLLDESNMKGVPMQGGCTEALGAFYAVASHEKTIKDQTRENDGNSEEIFSSLQAVDKQFDASGALSPSVRKSDYEDEFEDEDASRPNCQGSEDNSSLSRDDDFEASAVDSDTNGIDIDMGDGQIADKTCEDDHSDNDYDDDNAFESDEEGDD